MPFQTVQGARLHYQWDGAGEGAPVLLLVHALGTTAEMWQPQLDTLGRHFRLLRYDGRGHGRSEVTGGPYTAELLGGDAQGLLDALGLKRVHVLGLSMGGMVAQWLAIRAPERVDRLVIANSSAHPGAPEVWNQRIALVGEQGTAPLIAGLRDRWFTTPFQQQEPATVARIMALVEATDPRGYAAAAAAVRDLDCRDALHAVRAPTLVITGRHDQSTPPAHGALIAERIAGAVLVELDAAHLSNVEAATAFDTVVEAFLVS